LINYSVDKLNNCLDFNSLDIFKIEKIPNIY